MEIRSVTKRFKHGLTIFSIYCLYVTAFPKAERVAFRSLLSQSNTMWERELLAFYSKKKFIGFAYLISQNDLTFISFLAVTSRKRSNGLGFRILQSIKKLKPEQTIILEVERLDPAYENYQQRVKRKRFYEKNQFVNSEICFKAFDVEYELLIYGHRAITQNEFSEFYYQLTNHRIELQPCNL
ncbi:MAG: GNAT family N-acetyltransferase [Enterococcus sp.]